VIDGDDIIDFRKVPIGLVEINPISYDEHVIDIFSKIVGLDLNFSPSLLIEKGTDFYGAGVQEREPILQKPDRSATVDDIFDDENILAFDGNLDIFGDLNLSRGLHSGPITGNPNKIYFEGNFEMADQIGEEYKGALKDADQHEFVIAVIFRDLLRETLDDGTDLFPGEQWIEMVSLHTLYPVGKPQPLR
jgi:hypothetical protein